MNFESTSKHWLFAALLSCAACSAGGAGNGSRAQPSGSGNAAGGSGSGSGQPVLQTGGSAGGLNIDVGGGPAVKDPNDPRDVPVRQKTCDENGENCTCLRLALLGTLESAADNKDTQPFIDWLNGNSDGSARVTMVSAKPTLTADWLADYDVLVVANVNGWTFSDAEKAAVATWSKEQGGGVISLTGFVSTAEEPAATSQLISFAGLSYNATRTAENGQSEPVYYQGGSTDLKDCLAWTGSSDAIITTPIRFTAQTGAMAKLTDSLDYVGAFIGYGVDAPAGATTVATDPVSGQAMAVAMEVEGKGRVLAFGDEWVIFKNQWEPSGSPSNLQMDQYNKCWVPAAGSAPGFFQSVKTLYQTKQFWYDAINWVAPPSECNFTVSDPDVVVK